MNGEIGILPESELEPVQDLPGLEQLPEDEAPLDQAVVLKLNGGLGTSMGLRGTEVTSPRQERPDVPSTSSPARCLRFAGGLPRAYRSC
jgi:hypothetical protein